MDPLEQRRGFLTLAGASLALLACQGEKGERKAEDVGAVEDLMREHGVIRRILVVYRETAPRLRVNAAVVPPAALQQAALLMQNFGENYHEKLLEEERLFPAVKKAGGPAASLIDPLIAQHQRGREITDYVLSSTKQTIASANAESLASALEGFARMYEEHAAQEDTVVFQAWKKALSKKQLSDMGDQFEEIEHKTFGKDGFDYARDKIANIEGELGITLGGFLPPPPPKT
ncbi:MAG TPA: hemerythrin domain-containing protein [Polyangiaceae bacterium]|jgi:hemerythrin-like domain-containing protein|nr:hemerythrin domain-containing protein [Polyangiaceae bacterium]